MSLDLLLDTLKTYGPWGVLLLVVLFIVLRGEFTFRYPRPRARRARKQG